MIARRRLSELCVVGMRSRELVTADRGSSDVASPTRDDTNLSTMHAIKHDRGHSDRQGCCGIRKYCNVYYNFLTVKVGRLHAVVISKLPLVKL